MGKPAVAKPPAVAKSPAVAKPPVVAKAPAKPGAAASKPPVNASKNKVAEEEAPLAAIETKPGSEQSTAEKVEAENTHPQPIHAKYSRKKEPSFNLFIVFYQTQLNLARVYARLENWDKAKQYYKEVINKDPKVVYFENSCC